MKAQSAYYTLGRVNGYDALEVHTVAMFFDDWAEQICDGEDLPEEGPVYWSLYGHTPNEGIECIGNFDSFEEACSTAEKLGGVAKTSWHHPESNPHYPRTMSDLIKEQIQEDIITFADDLGLDQDQVDALCEIVIKNFLTNCEH